MEDNISANTNINQPSFSAFSFSEELEIKLHNLQPSHGMATLLVPTNDSEFASTFLNLSRKAQYLFRILENWKYAECFPSQFLLAKLIGVSREWLNKLLKILSDLQLVVKHYRHRQTCLYFIPKKFKGLTWEKIKYLILKPPEFTPQFTPSTLTSTRNVNSSKNQGHKKGKKEKFKAPHTPQWLCHFKEFREKHPQLGNLFLQDPNRWWNMAAFPEHVFNRVVDEFKIITSQPHNINRPWAWFMARLLKLTPKSNQNWSLAGKLKKNKGLYEE